LNIYLLAGVIGVVAEYAVERGLVRKHTPILKLEASPK
jgi:hypothetical protein